MDARVMVMAGGTGGHVFPALAVAKELKERGADVFWLGAPDSFEAELVPRHGFPMELVTIRGLRGKGLAGWLKAPFTIATAMIQVMGILRRRKPGLVLGMGGFVTGPGGVVARLLGVPLVIHEQNAVPGLTNQLLSRIASRVLEAFPGSFPLSRKAEVTGNPVRAEIVDLEVPESRFGGRGERRNLLVLGGSQGAQILNQTLPRALARLSPELRPRIRHQAGRNKMDETLAAYQEMGVEAEVSAFLDDMAEAYGWADIVVCRSGALTISELAAAGVASVLVPFPHAVDDHQTRNAAYLVDGGAAVMLPQSGLNADVLAETLSGLLSELEKIRAMASSARALACPDAAIRVADICEEVAA